MNRGRCPRFSSRGLMTQGLCPRFSSSGSMNQGLCPRFSSSGSMNRGLCPRFSSSGSINRGVCPCFFSSGNRYRSLPSQERSQTERLRKPAVFLRYTRIASKVVCKPQAARVHSGGAGSSFGPVSESVSEPLVSLHAWHRKQQLLRGSP